MYYFIIIAVVCFVNGLAESKSKESNEPKKEDKYERQC